jgi:hypothetical protein
MDLNSMLDSLDGVGEQSQRQNRQEDKIDQMLFDDDDNQQDEDNKQKDKELLSQAQLKEKFKNFEERINNFTSEQYPNINLSDKLAEMERDASTSGMERVSGTINDLEIKLEHLIEETKQRLDNETLANLSKDNLEKSELRKIQKVLEDIQQGYEERIKYLWNRIEELELELDENQLQDNFPGGGGLGGEESMDDFSGLSQ